LWRLVGDTAAAANEACRQLAGAPRYYHLSDPIYVGNEVLVDGKGGRKIQDALPLGVRLLRLGNPVRARG